MNKRPTSIRMSQQDRVLLNRLLSKVIFEDQHFMSKADAFSVLLTKLAKVEGVKLPVNAFRE
jgi:hypothetical protein